MAYRAHWSWASGVPDGQLHLQAERGQTDYVRIDCSMEGSSFSAGQTTIPVYDYKSSVQLVRVEAATAGIARCAMVKKLPGIEDLIRPQ